MKISPGMAGEDASETITFISLLGSVQTFFRLTAFCPCAFSLHIRSSGIAPKNIYAFVSFEFYIFLYTLYPHVSVPVTTWALIFTLQLFTFKDVTPTVSIIPVPVHASGWARIPTHHPFSIKMLIPLLALFQHGSTVTHSCPRFTSLFRVDVLVPSRMCYVV